MVKKSNFIVPLIVYPFDVMVSFGESDEELSKRLKRFGIKETNIWKYETDYAVGRFCAFEGNQTLIRMRSVPKSCSEFGSLQHEIFHTVSVIMWKIGMKLVIQKSDEAYAYLVGYLTEKIYANVFLKG